MAVSSSARHPEAAVPTDDADDVRHLLERAAAGDAAGWRAVVDRYHDRLRRMVAVRLDPRQASRFDPSGVLQNAYRDAHGQLADYLRDPKLPFFLWLRDVASRHLGRPAHEVSLFRAALPGASSVALAAQLLVGESRPTEAADRADRQLRLQEALNRLDPLDREVLVLRHFEHLTRAETAAVLGIPEAAAAKRYLRALERLLDVFGPLPDGGGP